MFQPKPKRRAIAKPKTGRMPKNKSECAAFERIMSKGWTVTKRGWPDLACFNESGEFVAVECKRNGNERLKESQEVIMRALEKAGIKCYRYDPDTGFTRFSETKEIKRVTLG